MEVEIHQSRDVFDALRPEWNSLLRRSVTDSPFLTWEFQKTWWDCLGGGLDLALLTVRDKAGGLVGLAPLYADTGDVATPRLHLVGGVEVADYLDILVPAVQQREVLDAILSALCERCPYPWSVLDLRPLPEASTTRETLAALAGQRGLYVAQGIEEVCPVIDLPATFEAYLESLDKKQRHEIRRKLRRASAEAAAEWYMVDSDRDFDRAVDDFIELHQRSRAAKIRFMTAQMQAFFRALAGAMHAAGWLELSFIEVNGRRAASYMNFRYNDTTLVYNSGYDPQVFSALSPGVVLLVHLIESAIQNGRKRFDFLRGSEPYKYRMGARDTEVFYLTIRRA